MDALNTSADEQILLPGTLRVVLRGALVRKWRSEEEHYTERMQLGTIISTVQTWSEPGQYGGKIHPCYLLLFSNDSRMYVVSENNLAHPDHITDPGRLF